MLYLVGTPIGNLEDLSDRAKRILAEADFIAAEDTRVTRKLLSHLELHKPLVSYYEHNKSESGPRILERILAGETCALVSDAGMPAVSDPGEDLCALCAGAGVTVSVIPGPCAAVTALAASGLPTGRFTFEGFLSVSRKARKEHLESLADEERTMIFYEAPHKLQTTLGDLYAAFGDRRIALCREMTKLHEEILRTTLSGAVALCETTAPRGEYVLVVEGAEAKKAAPADPEAALDTVDALADSGLSLRDAVKQTAKETGIPKNVLYEAALRRRAEK